MSLITLVQWAELNGVKPNTARQRANRGQFKTAQKLGRDWFIDKDEPNIDNRVKTGKYKNWRKKPPTE